MNETRELKMPPKKMLGTLYLQYGTSWTIVAILGLCIFILLGIIFDPRFFVLALIWIFLVLPLMVAFLYFFYGMQPLTAFNSIPHKVIVNQNELRVRIIEIKENELHTESNIAQESNVDSVTFENPEKDFVVRKDLLRKIKSGGDYVLLIFRQNGWIWLPSDSFSSFDEYKSVIADLSNDTRQ